MKVAVTGALGQLGSELCRRLGDEAVALTFPQFDLADAVAVKLRIRDLAPDVLINCAAYTAVDKAEDEPELCFQVNSTAVGTLAEVCSEIDCKLVQISTDYVFGGTKACDRPFREDDPPDPAGVYAESKLRGEEFARHCADHLIVRTCGLYCAGSDGPIRGRNFADTMLSLSEQLSELKIVDDQWVSPSYVPNVARAIAFLARADHRGIFHVVDAGATTWYRFAETLFRLAGIDVACMPITTEQYGPKAPRPRYSVLSTDKYRSLGGPEMPSWESAIASYLEAQRRQSSA